MSRAAFGIHLTDKYIPEQTRAHVKEALVFPLPNQQNASKERGGPR